MRGLAGAIATLALGGLGVVSPDHNMRGVKSNRYPTGAGGKFAPFNTEADAKRAVRRAKRWLANKSKGPFDRPPHHIFQNAELAVAQYGQTIAD